MSAGARPQPADLAPLHWPITAAALGAFAAFADSRGAPGALPLVAMVLVAAHLAPARRRPGGSAGAASESGGTAETPTRAPVPATSAWPLRIGLLLLAFLGGAGQPPNETTTFLRAPAMDWLGHWAAVELTIQFWLGRTGPATTMGMVALATLLLIAGTHTYSGTLSLWITPPFLWLLGRAVRAYGHPGLPAAGIGRGGRSWRTVVAAAGASALAFGLGGALAGLLSLYRADLTRWSNDLLLGSATRTRSGLSTNPELGPTFRLSGTLERVLRLTGDPLPNHLRAHVFTQYRLGRWGPPVESRPRRLFEGSLPAPRGPLAPVRCEALKPTDGYLFTALESVGVDPGGNREVDWDFSTTGSLHSQDDPPEPWALLFPLGAAGPDPPQVGSLSRQGEPGEESRAVPAELDPRVRDLARTLAPPTLSPERRAAEITGYLLRTHQYSLTTNPGPGDPVSNFLLRKKAAHCEYFASAAVLLLRCAGVPARYVTGYYAHEDADRNSRVVRGRDAHAWAEAWLPPRGWTTVEATPPSGMPTGRAGPIPWWNRTWETAADSLARAMTLVRENALALLLSAGGVLALLTVLRRRRERQSRGQDTGYPIPDPTLARLAGRFEALLTSRGVPCPPHRPWSEHLARLAEIPAGATGSATPLDLHRAEAFVAAYNAARFGSGVPGSTSPPEGPAELLQALEGK